MELGLKLPGGSGLPYLKSLLPVPQASCILFQILSERVGVSGDSPCCSLDTISPEDLPRQGMGREVLCCSNRLF